MGAGRRGIRVLGTSLQHAMRRKTVLRLRKVVEVRDTGYESWPTPAADAGTPRFRRLSS